MRLKSLRIRNFRAHRDTTIPLSEFGCLIGENNAGKSSVLHALHFVLKGTPPSKIRESDYHDESQPIRVELNITDISSQDLERIATEGNRTSVENILDAGAMTLVRSAEFEGKSTLQILTHQPKGEKWDLDALNELMKGKKNPELRNSVVAVLPELDAVLDEKPTQSLIREGRLDLISKLADDDMELRGSPLPTGIEAAMKPLLPEVIYIEAVKDSAGEAKSNDSSTFGKLLKILLDEVSESFADIERQFAEVQRKLSRVRNDDGTEVDQRLSQVKLIETTIESLVRESFPEITLRMDVPAPELRTILSGAELRVNDGHEGAVSDKGDGLKRTVAFAILRAYTALKETGLAPTASVVGPRPAYLLMFEEPELYLHPRAQRQLFAALSSFSIDHPVLVTTHSPVFFSGESTTSFVKLEKTKMAEEKAYVRPLPIDLSDVSERDSFQMICHENKEAGLFARTVVLVEGDSDVVVFPHLAKLLNSEWDDVERSVMFVKSGGKSSIERYRKFFSHFDIRVHAIVDLDALVDGLEKVQFGDASVKAHTALKSKVGERFAASTKPEPKASKVADGAKRGDLRSAWIDAAHAYEKWLESGDKAEYDKVRVNMDSVFSWPLGKSKVATLKEPDEEMSALLSATISAFRKERIHVVQRGDLESYLGSEAASGDKVRQAVEFCADMTTIDKFRQRHGSLTTTIEAELKYLLEPIFEETAIDHG